MLHAPLLKEKITEKLREQIIQMRSDDMIKIPSERTLAETLKVSRPSIRAAIKNLINEGLLIQQQGVGTYVTPKVKINTLHIICSPDIKMNDPFYNSFLVEITNFAAKQSLKLFVLDVNQIKGTCRDEPLVIVGLLEDELLNKLTAIYKTIIAFQDYPHNDDFIQIYFDHYKIGYTAAKILTEFGHKNVIHLAGPEKYASALNRKIGFISGAKEFKMTNKILTGKMNWSGGYDMGDTIVKELSVNAKNRPTAIFVANDWMAVGLMQKLKENGFKIPEDISIVGCDNIHLASEVSPSLSTFSQDMKLLIGELFVVLNQIIRNERVSCKKIAIPPSFIQRDSLTKV